MGDLGRRATAVVLAACVAAGVISATSRPASAAEESVVIVASPGRAGEVSAAITRLGGTVHRRLDVIDGLAATVPGDALPSIAARGDVAAMTPDARLHPMGSFAAAVAPQRDVDTGGSAWVSTITGAQDLWRCGITGKGVKVALVDTGVSLPTGWATVENGPDLSFDALDGVAPGVDLFGHGTHLASLLAGHDPNVTIPSGPCELATGGGLNITGPVPVPTTPSGFVGIAPDATIVNVKVGARDGAVDVSQVIAAIDWVVNQRRNGVNPIQVLALAYGTDSTQSWALDPLSFAVEQAWRSGITVLAAAGNDGTSLPTLATPATNPNVIAVGGADFQRSNDPADWKVADFASRGTSERGPDILMPAVSLLGVRAPGSAAEAACANEPSPCSGRFIRGSGTSQATALAAGMVALMLQRETAAVPKPGQIKKVLVTSSDRVRGLPVFQGAGLPSGRRIVAKGLASVATSTDASTLATGLGTLDGARGTGRLEQDGVVLTGEVDVLGRTWSSASWAARASTRRSWVTTRGMEAWIGGDPTEWSSLDAWDDALLVATPASIGGYGVDWYGQATTTSGAWQNRRWVGASWTNRRWVADSWQNRRWVTDSWENRRWVSDSWSASAWR